MVREFCICSKSCKAESEVIREAAEKMRNYKTQIENVKRAIMQCSGSGYSGVGNVLANIAAEAAGEINSLDSLRAVLEQSIQLYEQTESKIVNAAAGNDEAAETGDALADLLNSIANFRGNWWGVSMESLLMRGIFADYVLDDFMKILGGNFLTSYWKDGRLNFKLHHNNLTNRQAAEWLADNLGGNWSDYLSRNMKNGGFSVFENGEGAMRKLRYFDQVTDAELVSYIKDLKKWEEMSFGKAFKNNFRMLDDFDYSKFKDLGKLGKAGKIMGTVGTLLTVGGDVVENFYDENTGTWSYSNTQLADCTVDIGIDIATGAGSAAVGAAVGSLIVPPVGTVVGAGVGIAVDYAANNVKLFDVDGDGKKDSLVESAKIAAHTVVDGVADWGSDIGDSVSDWFGKAFAF